MPEGSGYTESGRQGVLRCSGAAEVSRAEAWGGFGFC